MKCLKIDQDNLNIKFSALNTDFSSPSADPLGSRTFKVIDVDKYEKPVIGASYDMQHVCTYLQLFSHYTIQ